MDNTIRIYKQTCVSETSRKLLLQHNRLARLPRDVIESLKQLVLINLAHNEIAWLDVGAFSSTSLRHVDLLAIPVDDDRRLFIAVDAEFCVLRDGRLHYDLSLIHI